MNDDSRNLTRRTALKGIAGGAATVGLGGAAFLAATGGAAATGHFNYGQASVTSNDGTVEYVAIFGDSEVSWTGFEKPATEAQIVIDVVLDGPEESGLYTGNLHDTGKFALDSDTDGNGGPWGGTGESITLSDGGRGGAIKSNVGYNNGTKDEAYYWDVVGSSNDYPLPQNPIPSDYLTVGGDGDSATYTIRMPTTYRWYAADGTTEFEKSFESSLTVAVNNKPRSSTPDTGTASDGVTSG